MSDCVIVFARYPRPGTVKTRLAQAIGDDAAAAFYAACAERLFAKLRDLPSNIDLTVFYDDPADEHEVRSWVGDRFTLHPQSSGDLGERMRTAFDVVFHTHARVVIVGTDIPSLGAHHVVQAFQALRSHDAVIGPTLDGGYYLLGMKSMLPVFQEVPWSTALVLSETRSMLVSAGASWAELETLEDVDTIEQMRRNWPP